MVCRDESEDRRTPVAGASYDFRALDHKQFEVFFLNLFFGICRCSSRKGIGGFLLILAR